MPHIELTSQIRYAVRSDADARLCGFTRVVYAECQMTDGVYLIAPDADLMTSFQAWDTDELRFVKLNGWLWTFEDTEG